MRYKIGRIIIDKEGERRWELLAETEYLYQAKYRMEEIMARNYEPQFFLSLKLIENEREIGHIVMAPTLIIDS